MQDMKIRIESPEHCRQIQDALFAAGYRWNTANSTSHYEPCVEDGAWIFAYADGWLTWDHEVSYGEGHTHKEYIYTPQKNFVKREDYYKQPETPSKKYCKGCNVLTCGGCPDAGWEGSVEKVYEPIGLLPKAIHDKQRMYEILDAMRRYVDAGKKIPMSWICELDDLGGEYVEEEF